MYKFIETEKNTNSSSDFNMIKFEKITKDPKIYTFKIFNEKQIKPFIYQNCITLDEVSGEYKKNARVTYDLEFIDYKTHLGENITGKLCTVERPELKDEYHKIFYGNSIACKPIKDDFKLDDNCCNGHFIIYEDNQALLMRFGSGVHYWQVSKGIIKKVR